MREGCHYSGRFSGGCSVVLVDETAEPVATMDLACRRSRVGLRLGRPKFERAMRPLAVVVVDVDAEHAIEVAPAEDQQPVHALGMHGADEALGDRVRLRCSHRDLDDPGALATEDLVEGAAVLAVAVADQEADALLGEVEAEVARLLGDPGATGILRAAGEPDAAALMRDEEEDVVAAQKYRLDGEEVAGDDCSPPARGETRASSARCAVVPAPAAPERADDGHSSARRRSRACRARRRSAGGPSADSRVRAVARVPEPQL